MDRMSHPSFGDALRRHRVAANLSQGVLAERAGLSARTIGAIEPGTSGAPYHDSIDRLALALALSREERDALHALVSRRRPPRPGPAPAVTPSPLRPTALPVYDGPPIGRDGDAAAVAALLGEPGARLLTLTGPGGVGKTRLAVRVADAARAAFPAGVFFTPLDTVPDAGLVLAAIARGLGLRGEPNQSAQDLLDTLKDALRDTSALLLLDTFEHVVAAAPQVADLLAACPGLKVLVTSRIALRVRGEKRYAVTPLALPPGAHGPGDPAHSAAILLFAERARDAAPLFALTAANAAPVARICALLDGLPLAIELAAARLDVLSLSGVLARLETVCGNVSLQVLAGGARDLPPRQRGMRETLAWSYRLLDGAARDLLPRLAACADAVTLDMVVAVCGVDSALGGGGDAYVLEGLTSLVESNLLRREERDGEPRFTMPGLVRAYGLDLPVTGAPLASAQAPGDPRQPMMAYTVDRRQVARIPRNGAAVHALAEMTG